MNVGELHSFLENVHHLNNVEYRMLALMKPKAVLAVGTVQLIFTDFTQVTGGTWKRLPLNDAWLKLQKFLQEKQFRGYDKKSDQHKSTLKEALIERLRAAKQMTSTCIASTSSS